MVAMFPRYLSPANTNTLPRGGEHGVLLCAATVMAGLATDTTIACEGPGYSASIHMGEMVGPMRVQLHVFV